jgi:hypothetical protein
MRVLAIGLATTILLSVPLGVFAQHRSGGHAAPMRVSAPQTRSAVPRGGFDLHEEISAPPRMAAPPHVNAPVIPKRSVTVAHPTTTVKHPALIGNLGYGNKPGNRRVIQNPRYHGSSWGWNHGVTWNPASPYWGGGFWGPFALGAAGAAFFGTIYYNDNTVLTSYQITPDSPGAQLLMNYQLTQVPCGLPNLVVISGPDDSVICAEPNDLVAPGEYQLDPSQLTIVSLDQ